MNKRRLQSGIIAGALWCWWIIITIDPKLLQMVVHNTKWILTPFGIRWLGAQAAIVILILGFITNQTAIVGFGCLSMIGLDIWELSLMQIWRGIFRGARGIVAISCLLDVLCFFLLLYLLIKKERPERKILAASVLALVQQITAAIAAWYPRTPRDLERLVPAIVMYVTAVLATGMYCAGMKPEMLNELFSKIRASDTSVKGSGSSPNITGRGSNGKSNVPGEDILKLPGSVSEENRKRISNLKSLLDNGLMSREEYNEMVDKIRKS